MRLIDAEVFEELFKKQIEYGATDIFDAVEDALQDTPTIDAAPVVHARWIYSGDMDLDGNSQGYCSRCGAGDKHRADLKNFVPYCWKCGARMDGESEEDTNGHQTD